MKVYVAGSGEKLEEVFKWMICSAQSNVEILFPYRDTVLVAKRHTTIKDLKKALRDKSSLCRLDPDQAKKFLVFWDALQKRQVLDKQIPPQDYRNNLEWVIANRNLQFAFHDIRYGGRLQDKFIVDIVVSRNKRKRFIF